MIHRVEELCLSTKAEEQGEPSIAILVHSWDRAEHYRSLFETQGIRAAVQGGSGLLGTREVEHVVTWLEALVCPDRTTALLGALRSAGFGISDAGLYCLSRELGSFRSTVLRGGELDTQAVVDQWGERDPGFNKADLSVLLNQDAAAIRRFHREFEWLRSNLWQASTADVLSGFLDRNGLWSFWHGQSNGRQRIANLQKFLQFVREFERINGISLHALLEHLDQTRNASDPASGGLEASGGAPVVITTFWQAKGLEWPIVVLPDLQRVKASSSEHDFVPKRLRIREGGMDEVIFAPEVRLAQENRPMSDAATPLSDLIDQFQKPAQRAEMRRLLYVAMTRARDKVVLSGVFDVPTTKKADEQPLTLCHTGNWADTIRISTDIRFDASTRRPYFRTVPWRRLQERGLVDIHDGLHLLSKDMTSESTVTVEVDLPDGNTIPILWAPVGCDRVQTIHPSEVKLSGTVPAVDPKLSTPLPASRNERESPFPHEAIEGTAFHALAELVAFREMGRSDLEEAAHDVLRSLALEHQDDATEERVQRLSELWELAMQQTSLVDELRAASLAGQLFHELPIRFRDADGTWVDGAIDLVWRDGSEEVHLLDYKTGWKYPIADDPEGGKVSKHFAQVKLYAQALGLVTGESVSTAGIWYVAGETVLRWTGKL